MRQDAGSQWAGRDQLVAGRVLDGEPPGIGVGRRERQLDPALWRRDRQFKLAVLFLQIARRGRDIAVCLTQLKYVQQPDSARRDWQLETVRMNGFVLCPSLAHPQRRRVCRPEGLPRQFLVVADETQLATGSRRLVPAAEGPLDGRLPRCQAEEIVQDIDAGLQVDAAADKLRSRGVSRGKRGRRRGPAKHRRRRR